jgi:hypothetical protein
MSISRQFDLEGIIFALTARLRAVTEERDGLKVQLDSERITTQELRGQAAADNARRWIERAELAPLAAGEIWAGEIWEDSEDGEQVLTNGRDFINDRYWWRCTVARVSANREQAVQRPVGSHVVREILTPRWCKVVATAKPQPAHTELAHDPTSTGAEDEELERRDGLVYPDDDPEHQCGGPQEACCEPGCRECGTKSKIDVAAWAAEIRERVARACGTDSDRPDLEETDPYHAVAEDEREDPANKPDMSALAQAFARSWNCGAL